MPARVRNQLLIGMAEKIAEHRQELLQANQLDINQARNDKIGKARIDRLLLDNVRIDALIESLDNVAKLPDPLASAKAPRQLENGLKVYKQRVPLGVILMIYESRPNVTVDALALSIKSANAVILKGGREAANSNQYLFELWSQVFQDHNLKTAPGWLLAPEERALVAKLLKRADAIDLVIPRGGTALIEFVSEHSRIPVIKHDRGICHLYVSASAEQHKALQILLNGKVQRPGVCNALETLLVAENIAADFVPIAVNALKENGVVIKGCARSRELTKDIDSATAQDYDCEYLARIINLRVVEGVEAACEHIRRYGSRHTEVIVSENKDEIDYFINHVDAGSVMVNASSRFADGGEMGLGAEVGISTSKLHCYGPMGPMHLTTERYLVVGDGQVRP